MELAEDMSQMYDLVEENSRLKLRIGQVEEHLFELQASALTCEVEAAYHANSKVRSLESQLSFKDQEIARLIHELAFLSKKEQRHSQRNEVVTNLSAEPEKKSQTATNVPEVVVGVLDATKLGGADSGKNGLVPATSVPTFKELIDEKVDLSWDKVFNKVSAAPARMELCHRLLSCSFSISQRVVNSVVSLFGEEFHFEPRVFSPAKALNSSGAAHLIKSGGSALSSAAAGPTPSLERSLRTPNRNSAASTLAATTTAGDSIRSKASSMVFTTPEGAQMNRNLSASGTAPVANSYYNSNGKDGGGGENGLDRTNHVMIWMDGKHKETSASSVNHFITNLDVFYAKVSTGVLTVAMLKHSVRLTLSLMQLILLPVWKHVMGHLGRGSDLLAVAWCDQIELCLASCLQFIEILSESFRDAVALEYEEAYSRYETARLQYTTMSAKKDDRGLGTVSTIITTDGAMRAASLKRPAPAGHSSPLAKKLFRYNSNSPMDDRYLNGNGATLINEGISMNDTPAAAASSLDVLETSSLDKALSLKLQLEYADNLIAAEASLVTLRNRFVRFSAFPSAILSKIKSEQANIPNNVPSLPSLDPWDLCSLVRVSGRLNALARHLEFRCGTAKLSAIIDADQPEPHDHPALGQSCRDWGCTDQTRSEMQLNDIGVDIVQGVKGVLWAIIKRRSTGPKDVSDPCRVRCKDVSDPCRVRCAAKLEAGCIAILDKMFRGKFSVRLWTLDSAAALLAPLSRAAGSGSGLAVPFVPRPSAPLRNHNYSHIDKCQRHSSRCPVILCALSARGLSWANRRLLLSTISAAVLYSERAFDVLLRHHVHIEFGSSPVSHGLVRKRHEGLDPIPANGNGESVITGRGPDGGLSSNGAIMRPEDNIPPSACLMSVLCKHLIEHCNIVGHMEMHDPDVVTEASRYSVEVMRTLVRLLETYKERCVPLLFGFDPSRDPPSSAGAAPIDYVVPSKKLDCSVLLRSPGLSPQKSKQGRRDSYKRTLASSGRGAAPSPLVLTPSRKPAPRQSTTGIAVRSDAMMMTSGEEGSLDLNEPVEDTFFDILKFRGVLNRDLLVRLVTYWADIIRLLDSTPEHVESDSAIESTIRACVELPSVLVLLARHTRPSLKELSRDCGVNGQLQCLLYKIWTHRAHPSMRAVRNQVGFLGSLLS